MEWLAELHARRLERWAQTAQRKLPGHEAAPGLLARLGLVTHFPVSPQVPNLYSAYMGDENAQMDMQWDSPAGEVFTWRWLIGRQAPGLYVMLVRKRPTWVTWELLPAVLRLSAELRMPDELVDTGMLSSNAYRLAQALEEAGGTLSTRDLKAAAGFPGGRDQRLAFHKAIDELDARLMLAKVFVEGSDEMSHALVYMRYRRYVDAAERLTREQALDTLLQTYLPGAVYAVPDALARHLRLEKAELCGGLDRLRAAGRVEVATFPDVKGSVYVWREE